MKPWFWTALLFLIGTLSLHGQGGKTCVVQHLVHNDAADALINGKYVVAAELYSKQLTINPDATAAKVGLVRSLLGQGKVADALRLSTDYVKTPPPEPLNAALLDDLYGEVRFRRGEVVEAGIAFNKAAQEDSCLGRVHYDVARFQRLNGNFLTAQKQADIAHKLAPEDRDISTFRISLRSGPAKEDVVLPQGSGGATDQQAPANVSVPGAATAEAASECVASDSTQPDTVKMALFEVKHDGGDMSAVGLEVEFNGKKRHLEVDSGATGLIVTRAFADSAGLVPEGKMRVGGSGDEGSTAAFIAHVEKVRVGGMEFHHCRVIVLEKSRQLEIDGLVGLDVFGRWLVTLDTPMRELRLSALPPRPGETATAKVALPLETSGTLGTDAETSTTGVHDRYIAPEMQNWTRIYRDQHLLIIPTRVNGLSARLFVIDTGAFSGSLTPALGRELGNLVETDAIIRGLSGEAAHVYTVDKQVVLDFGGVRQPLRGISVMENGALGLRAEVDIAGFIGFTTLKELAISIDYRDNLMKILFDPKRGFHSLGNMAF